MNRYTFRLTPSFDRDRKRLIHKHYDMGLLDPVIDLLEYFDDNRQALMNQYRDHALKGDWAGYRELHIQADWLLVYRVEADEVIIVLTRTGSHGRLL